MPSLILSNPLGSDDAQEVGLSPREYVVGEVVTVSDFVFATLIRTGYGMPYGAVEDILLIGDGDPSEAIGDDGQWYLDRLNEILWGPKFGGYWPSNPIRPDRGVQHLAIGADHHLRVTYSTGTVVDLGSTQGDKGDTGATGPTGAKGDTGAAGTNGTNGTNGRGFTPRGAWATGTVYAVDDIVTNSGSTYRSKTAHTAGATFTGAGTNWELWAAQGPQGAQGPAGSGAADATTTAKGSVRLAGDLGGTADAPQVVSGANHGHTAAQISDAGTAGRQVLTAATAADVRAAAAAAAVDASNGVLLPTYAELTQQAAPTAPAAGKSRLYLDSAGLLQLLLPGSGGARRIPADLGEVTTLPAAGMTRGDTVRHTGIGCVFLYTGLAWRQVNEPTYPDAATRLAVPTGELPVGFRAIQTDTMFLWRWTGTAWQLAEGVPGKKLWKTGTALVGPTVWAVVTWESRDTGTAGTGMFSSGSNTRLVAPIAGRYRSTLVLPSNIVTSSTRQGHIRLNATNYPAQSTGSLTAAFLQPAVSGLHVGTVVADEIVMAAGDWVEAYAFSTVASTPFGTQNGYEANFTLTYTGPV